MVITPLSLQGNGWGWTGMTPHVASTMERKMVCNTLPAGQIWCVCILCVCLYESNVMFLFVLSHPNSGSFIRPTRLNLGRTFCEVVKEVNYLCRACSIFFLLLTFLHKIIFQFLLSCDTLKLPFSSSLCLWLFSVLTWLVSSLLPSLLSTSHVLSVMVQLNNSWSMIHRQHYRTIPQAWKLTLIFLLEQRRALNFKGLTVKVALMITLSFCICFQPF